MTAVGRSAYRVNWERPASRGHDATGSRDKRRRVVAYSAESGDREHTASDSREWLLGCEGFSVEGPDGFVGTVLRALYEPSARWDRPSGLLVRAAEGAVIVPMDRVETVHVSEGRIGLTGHVRPAP